jgi:hypothetical protein
MPNIVRNGRLREDVVVEGTWRLRRSAAGVRSASLMATLAGTSVNAEVYAFGRSTIRSLFSVYAMRMAAVLTLAVSTVGIRTSAVPCWVSYLGYLVGLTLLVAAGAHQWTQLVLPAWVLLLSLVILFDRPLSHASLPQGELSTDRPA